MNHAFGGKPDHVEGSDQVDRDYPGERLQRHHAAFTENPGRRRDPGAVDHDTQLAQAGSDIERGVDLFGVGDVSGREGGLAKVGGDLLAA